MGHFIFMNESTYKDAFGKEASQNATILTLKDHSDKNVEQTASRFMSLDGVKGDVQNTTLKAQIKTIVNSLSRVMGVLIRCFYSSCFCCSLQFNEYQCGRAYPRIINH